MVGYHSLLQGIFLTTGSNLHFLRLLHWQAGSFTTGITQDKMLSIHMMEYYLAK